MNFLSGVDNKEAEIITKNKHLKMTVDKFWKCFKETIQINKCGLDGKQQILSIITESFGFREIQNKLQVSLIL